MSGLMVRSARRSLATLVFLVGLATAVSALAQQQASAYTADLVEVNPQLTDQDVSGQALFTVSDGQLHISLVVKGVAPGMHLAHFHGFMTDQNGTCPDAAADTNADGVVDLLETEPFAGTTLVPFTSDPAGLVIETDTYPVATADGLFTYAMTVPLGDLETAMTDAYGIEQVALGERVIFVHGVADGVTLPETAQSLPGVPASVTVPIACGAIDVF